MKKTKDIVLNAISEICIEKSNRKAVPIHATDVDILERTGLARPEMEAALNELVRDGRLEWGKTININYFRRKPRG